jgi:hypothetical protein
MTLLALFHLGCTPGTTALDETGGVEVDELDSDGDGLTDAEEAALGTDAGSHDTDMDGLSDLEEVLGGTDPRSADTDGDSYLDPWELDQGTDPTDPESRIYTGYWPYNPDKDALAHVDDVRDTVGAQIPRLQLVDQFGDTVDLYDFAGQDVPIVVHLSAMGCGVCNGLASYLSGGNDHFGWEELVPGLREAIVAGELIWITVLCADLYGGDATADDAASWYAQYPLAQVPVLADDGAVLQGYGAFWPAFLVVDSDMVLVGTAGGDVSQQMEPLLDLLRY